MSTKNNEVSHVPSPCKVLCRRESGRNAICIDCKRTLAQISVWKESSEDFKIGVWLEILDFGYEPESDPQIRFAKSVGKNI